MSRSERDRYVKAWGDRRARLFMLAAMVAGLVASVAFWANAWLAAAFLAGALIGAYGYREFRCPRCDQRFLSFAHTGRCRSCGLAKNALPEERRRPRMDIDRKAFRPWLARLREVLNREWDPIGVDPGGDGAPADEYDTYRDRIASMIVAGATDAELVAYLQRTEDEVMGARPSRGIQPPTARTLSVIAAIRALGPPPR